MCFTRGPWNNTDDHRCLRRTKLDEAAALAVNMKQNGVYAHGSRAAKEADGNINNSFPCFVFQGRSEDLAENSLDLRRLLFLLPLLCQGYLFECASPVLRWPALRSISHIFVPCFFRLIFCSLLPFRRIFGLDPIENLGPLDVADKLFVLAGCLGDFGTHPAGPFGIFGSDLFSEVVPAPVSALVEF